MKLEIFDKATRNRLDVIKTFSYVEYKDEANSYGNFSVIMYPDEEVIQYLKFGNYILFEDGALGIIKGLKNYEQDILQIEVYGFMCNHILTYRSFLKTTKYTGTVPQIARQMVTDLYISPEDAKRKIDFIKLSDIPEYNPEVEGEITVQNTGDNLLNVLNDKFLDYDLLFWLFPNMIDYDESMDRPVNLESLEFRIRKPVHRTIGNEEGVNPVVFSFELNNLSDLTYEEDGRDYASVAIVAAEGTGQQRKVLEVGDVDKTGIDRIELYVDARDIQSGSSSSGGGDSGGGGDDGGGGTDTDMTYQETLRFLNGSGQTDVQPAETTVPYDDTLNYLNGESQQDTYSDENTLDYDTTKTYLESDINTDV